MKVVLAILLCLLGCAVCRPTTGPPSTGAGIRSSKPVDICYVRVATQSCYGQVTARLSTEAMQVTRSYDVGEQQNICFPVFCSDRNLTKRTTLDLLEASSQRSLSSFDLDTTYNELYTTIAECRKAKTDGANHAGLKVSCDTGDVELKASSRKGKRYQNTLDQPLLVICNNKYAFHRIESWHHNGAEDREYQFDCQFVAEVGFDQCSWTDYVNHFDKPAMYHCPADWVMTGVDSFHDNFFEDRRWRFKCCNFPNYYTKSCQSSGYLNEFDQYINYYSPSGTLFTGAYSYHENWAEDRRWMIQSCSYLSN